jgi:hypothetical protein
VVPYSSLGEHEVCPHKRVQAGLVVVTDNFSQKHCLADVSSRLPNFQFISIIVLLFQDISYCKLVLGDSLSGIGLLET